MSADGDLKPDLFASPEAYLDGFEAGLRRVLGESSLGAFILVLANASFDAARYRRFRNDLDLAMARWCDAFDRGLPEAQDAPSDDAEVFRQLRDIGLDDLDVTQWRDLGPWRLQFNAVRALRPPRMSDAVVERLRRPFEPKAFHFNKPFLRPEILWEGCWQRPMRLLYNKFPFAPGHGLLVPEPGLELPQYLEQDRLGLLWNLALAAGEGLPGIGFGYNALGAYASVNHLHFQLFVDPTDARFPVELPRWRHNGGTDEYPLQVTCFDDPSAAWRRVEQLQLADRAFNLLLRPGRLLVIERARQGSYRHSAWTGGFAWSEVAGSITLFERGRFESLDEAVVATEFDRLRSID